MSLQISIPPTIKLRNLSYCRYLTVGPSSPEKFRSRDIVKAIKGVPFNGYTYVEIAGQHKRLDEDRSQVAYDWFADRVALETRFAKNTAYFLCPIPDSECTTGCGRPSKTLKLAKAVVARNPRVGILDVLRLSHPVPKSSATGIRDEEALFSAMVCTIKRVPDAHLILLDDVCTTGSHAKAAARRLMAHGADHLSAMSVARTTWEPDDELFGLRVDNL